METFRFTTRTCACMGKHGRAAIQRCLNLLEVSVEAQHDVADGLVWEQTCNSAMKLLPWLCLHRGAGQPDMQANTRAPAL